MGGGEFPCQEERVTREQSSLKCFKGLQTVRMLCVCFEDRNLARNQSTHMLITYSMTKRKQKPHKFLQPSGSQCLLPLINFLELSLSTYLRTWSICQPQETLPAPAVGAWGFWVLCHTAEEGRRGAHGKLRLPHSDLFSYHIPAPVPAKRNSMLKRRTGCARGGNRLPASVSPNVK